MFEEKIPYHLVMEGFTGFPRMLRARQIFDSTAVADISETVNEQMEGLLLPDLRGKRIAITAGSRGIPNFRETIAAVGRRLRGMGACPFVVPAMGSHGNADAAGQVEVLADYGMTEETLEMPILSSLDTVVLGTTEHGSVVYCDRVAFEADGIVVCGRVKPHTDFRGPIESGLCKMMVVGLGNHRGAVSFHKSGSADMASRIQSAAGLFIQEAKVLFGVALIDNAYHGTKRIELVRPEAILPREPELLIEARAAMPQLRLSDVDVLIVDWYGKEISGAGMDPNVTGRMLFAPHERTPGCIHPRKIAALRLTDASAGNAAGIGIADFISRKLACRIDLATTYTNSLSSPLGLGKIPMVLNNDRETIYAAASCCGAPAIEMVRMVRIENTLNLEDILISENLRPETEDRDGIDVVGEPEELLFDEGGDLIGLE